MTDIEIETVPDYGDAESYINDPAIEMAWAVKAAERANIHMNLLMNCDTSKLKLNKLQEEIVAEFRKAFPDMDVHQVTEEQLKVANKDPWRVFCELFKDCVEDFNMGSLMRMDAAKSYSQSNSIIVPKIIYLAIEGARNMEGINEKLKAAYTEDHKQHDE